MAPQTATITYERPMPVTIPAGKEQEYSGTYLVRGSLPEGIKELKLTYDFRILE